MKPKDREIVIPVPSMWKRIHRKKVRKLRDRLLTVRRQKLEAQGVVIRSLANDCFECDCCDCP